MEAQYLSNCTMAIVSLISQELGNKLKYTKHDFFIFTSSMKLGKAITVLAFTLPSVIAFGKKNAFDIQRLPLPGPDSIFAPALPVQHFSMSVNKLHTLCAHPLFGKYPQVVQVTDTLHKPNTFLINYVLLHRTGYAIAVMDGNRFRITQLDFCKDAAKVAIADTVDVNGDGKSEAIITWSNYISSRSEMGGYDGGEQNFLIWDLQSNKALLAWKLTSCVTGYNYCFGTTHSGCHFNYAVSCVDNKLLVTDMQYPLPENTAVKQAETHSDRKTIYMKTEDEPPTTHKLVMKYTYINGMFIKTYQIEK